MSARENVYGPGPGNASGIAIGEEMGPIITALKEGSAMTRYYSNRKRQSDVRIFKLKMEEFQLVWCRKEGAREEDSGIFNSKLFSTEENSFLLRVAYCGSH